jgi:polar amino acid transport system substrate-binding protein
MTKQANRTASQASPRASRLAGAIAVAVLTLSGIQAASADTLDDVKKAGVLKIVTEMQTPPFDMMVNGAYVGYDKDLMDEVAKELGVKPAYTDLPWTSVLPALDAKQFDVSNSNVTVNKARVEKFAFTAPIAEASVILLKRADDNSINKPTDIAGKNIAGVKAGSALNLFNQWATTNNLKVDVREYVNAQQTFTDLANGRVDAAITTLAIGNYTAAQHPKQFKVVLPTFTAQHYFSWTLRKDAESASLVKAINAALGKIQDDGRMGKIQTKWFGVPTALPKDTPVPVF